MAVEVKVSCAENSHTARAQGEDALGTEKVAVAPQGGTLLKAEEAAAPPRCGREVDQRVLVEGGGGEEEEQKEEVCLLVL